MPKASYVVDLSDNEREKLLNIINNGSDSEKRILHADILLAADINNSSKASSAMIAERFQVHRQTVQTVRKTYATKGLEAALDRKKRIKPPIDPKLTGDAEARILAIFRCDPPPGFARWTLRLVAEEAVRLEIVPSLSHTSVGRILKKNGL